MDKYVVNLEGLIDGYVEFGWPILRYESLVDEPNETLKILFDRWNINVTEKKISNAIKNSSLKSMRKGGGKQLIKTHKSHFRKGGYGQYRKELPTKFLKTFLLDTRIILKSGDMISNFLSKNYKRLCIFIENNPIVFRISIGNFILFF